MPIEQIQKFLGHAKLETTQIYAESSLSESACGLRCAMKPSVVYSTRDGVARGGKRLPPLIDQRLSCEAVTPAGLAMFIEKPNHHETTQEGWTR
jgi:hypothetical protein